MEKLKIIAFTHRKLDISLIGLLHLSDETKDEKLKLLKEQFVFDECMYLSTCNRVELILSTNQELTGKLTDNIIYFLNPAITEENLLKLSQGVQIFENTEALQHLFSVASSMESLVVGEREIITQVRKAYEFCHQHKLTSDKIRLTIQQTILTAKQIYTETNIALHPVSVVSLACRKFLELSLPHTSRILVVGAGETNSQVVGHLAKRGYRNISVFNRTFSKANSLANSVGGTAFPLDKLQEFAEGFDVLITCTSSSAPIITEHIYQSLLQGDASRKIVIDLAVPADVDPEVISRFNIHLISVNNLETEAKKNLAQRHLELTKCSAIVSERVEETLQLFKEREIEIAFSGIPQKVKAIRETAVNEVFANDLRKLDPKTREVVDNLLAYMEKKYNAVAMKTAKETWMEN